MTPDATPKGRRRLLVVEDETLIGMLLEDMLTDLGYEVIGTTPTVSQAMDVVRDSELDAAILDVNVNGEAINPVAAFLKERGVPFMFASGYGERGVPAEFKGCPVLQKPFQQEELENALASLFAEGPGATKPQAV